jgi:ComF family protein
MCERLPGEFGLMRSATLMKGTGGKIVHLCKYSGWKSLADFMAMKIISAHWSDAGFWDADYFVPVPISRVRQRERGYNQSELLSRSLSELVGIPTRVGILERVSWRRPQVGLPYAERLRNVKNAFSVSKGSGESFTGCRIILVDDVITTGATVISSSRALKKAGIGRVSCVSYGRADDLKRA